MSTATSSEAIYDVSMMFSVVGFDGDPDEITGHLGFSPTRVVRKGQTFPPPRDPRYRAKHNVWTFRPALTLPDPLPHAIEMELVLRPFRAALEARLDKVASLPPGTASLSVYVLPWSVVPAFIFDPSSLEFLARLGVPFEIDIQNLGRDGEAG